MTLAKELVGPFNADMQLKAKLANSYGLDAFDLLRRVKAINHFIDEQVYTPNRSLKAKNFVDMVMAIECGLKSLMFSLALKSSTPESIYKKIRNKSHKVYDLALEVKVLARNRVGFLSQDEFDLLKKAQGLGVGSRYDLDVFFMITQEDYTERVTQSGKITSTIDNPAWLKKFHSLANKIQKLSYKTSGKYLEKHRAVAGNNLDKREQRFKSFAVSVHII